LGPLYSFAKNPKALYLAMGLNKGCTTGSDAHTYMEIGRGYLVLNGNTIQVLKREESLL